MTETDNIIEEEQPLKGQEETSEEASEKTLKEALQKIKETAKEEDPHPSQQINLRAILGGDLLTTQIVRSQIWLFILIVIFTIIYVAFRYQCQQDMRR